MPLPSQMDRTGELGRNTWARSSRRAGGGSRRGLKLILAAVVVLGAIWGLSRLLPGAPKETTDPTSQTAGLGGGGGVRASEVLPNRPSPKPAGRAEQPPVLRQGTPPSSTPSLTTIAPASPTDSGKPSPVDLTNPTGNPTGSPAGAPTGAKPTSAPTNPKITGAPGANEPATIPQAAPTLTPSSSTQEVRSLIEAGEKALVANNLVQARILYSRALLHPQTVAADQEALRSKLTAINQDLVFSPRVVAGDSLVETYVVQSGDSLERIGKRRQLATDWRLIQRVNRLSNPNRINVGQKLKLVRGPFHAVVSKASYRLDLFAGSPDEPETWVYVRSFPVGLGENNGTPLGTFVVKKHSKLVNPHWVNPQTGEQFSADDPKNPIGEHWIGIEGVGPSGAHVGYGLHGTIEPGSIGQQKSMGCVRMATDDIAMMYELLVEQISVVKIVP